MEGDCDYLPPLTSPQYAALTQDRETSLQPFLRSQGPADGLELVFNSRISPSPNRSIHRRRRHRLSTADSATPRRNLSREFDSEVGRKEEELVANAGILSRRETRWTE